LFFFFFFFFYCFFLGGCLGGGFFFFWFFFLVGWGGGGGGGGLTRSPTLCLVSRSRRCSQLDRLGVLWAGNADGTLRASRGGVLRVYSLIWLCPQCQSVEGSVGVSQLTPLSPIQYRTISQPSKRGREWTRNQEARLRPMPLSRTLRMGGR
jgi:hypothetical protein